MTSIFSVVSQIYKEDTALYIGYIESATTIGMCVGAPLGSFLNSYLGYQIQFYCLSGLFLFTMLLCQIFLPNQIIKESDDFSDIEYSLKRRIHEEDPYLFSWIIGCAKYRGVWESQLDQSTNSRFIYL